MSSVLYLYNKIRKYVLDGTIDFDTDTIKCMLVKSDYTFSAAHGVKADVCASPSPEVEAVSSPDNGYTAGGKAVTGVTLTEITSPPSYMLDMNDIEWTALTATFKYAIFYANVTRNGVTDPLIGCVLLDYEGGTSIIVNGVDYKLQISDDGFLVLG
jgi:hypothetical protein